MQSKKSILIKNLSVDYGEHTVLRSLNLEIPYGQIYYLLGSNGAGKSTLLKVLTKQISVAKESVLNIPKRYAIISQNPEESFYPSLSIEENCRMFDSNNRYSRSEILEHLSRFSSSLPRLFNHQAGKLSGGQKQALALALHLITPPDLLLLDEHTSALDPKAGKELMDLTISILGKMQITSILITHNLAHIKQYPAKIIGLKEGSIAIDKEMASDQLIKELFAQ